MFEEVNLSWEARSGKRFQIVASEKPLGDQHQYDLLIDGRSYFSLPRPSQLRAVRPDDVASDISLGSLEEEESTANCTEKGDAPEDVDVRLAIMGLTPSLEKTEDLDSLEDELTSEFFANCLESLRHRVTLMIPEMEDLLSRAIVNAFSEDRDSQSSFSSCSCSFESANLTPIQIETTAIWEAISWMELNIDNAPRPDVEDQKRMFLQKQVDTIFVHTRQGHLNEDAAVRTLCNVAKIVGVELKLPLPKDTVLLHGVNKHVNEEDVLCSLRMFGEIVDLAVSKGRRFGVCRFRYEDSADKVLAASATGSLAINGIAPSITPVEHQDTIRRQPCLDDMAQLEPSPTLLMPSLKRARSHQRNTITIDTAMSAAPFLTAENAPPVVSPEKAKTILQPDLINIPAMTTPQGYTPAVFDSPAVSP